MGRDEGAGDAWKVAPAKAGAGAAIGLGAVVCGGVVRPCFTGPGDDACFARALLPLRGFDLDGCCWDCGSGLLEADFWGVNGPARSMGKTASLGMSFSDAYVLRGELTGRFARRLAGVFLFADNPGCACCCCCCCGSIFVAAAGCSLFWGSGSGGGNRSAEVKVAIAITVAVAIEVAIVVVLVLVLSVIARVGWEHELLVSLGRRRRRVRLRAGGVVLAGRVVSATTMVTG